MRELEEMMEKKVARRRWEIGEKYEVEVIGKSKEYVYVDCGDKKEGLINIEELVDNDGNLAVREGQRIEAYYAGLASGFRIFTTYRHGFSTLDLKKIYDAYREQKALEGKVVREKKGGFEVEVGKIKCFCPYSQIGEKGEPPGDLLGKTLYFKVLTFEEDTKNIVLSRRALIEEEKQKRREMLKEHIKEGSTVRGRVIMIKDNGAIVDLEGIEAYLPKSEISWNFVRDVKDFLSVGETIEAKVKEVDWSRNKIVLSIKELFNDPYLDFLKKREAGEAIESTITRVEPFGVFVRLGEGLEGFVHRSRLGLNSIISDCRHFFKEGQILKVKVLDVDLQKRRISLSAEEVTPDIPYPKIGEILECRVVKVLQKGLLVETFGGILGYIPDSEANITGEKWRSKNYPVGTNLKAVVVEIDRERGRILLSEKKVKEFEEREAYLAYIRQMERETSFFRRLEDVIREKLK